ncbi:hypothetical protein C0Q70_21491 [Pomacea canaliculata]|uniref:VWFA domain-containing protein n=1 Tax=Pomacea canaliculata TaxID=400727 RepID=A0A2T7NCR8_POMCA|nr:hypothetical protein C0Q70_21491 [Pomacea canaliculata]
MTIILFLVDTSASMNQRTYLGTTLIDVAKAAVETFMKIRARDPNSRWDRYMLLTFEDPPANVKAGWKESHATFATELKNLKAGGLTTMGPSLKNAFDLLNLNRMQTGIDTYGQGRSPFYLEPAVIIVISDGGALTTPSSVQNELNLPMNTVVPGSELTKEPFRWDQRIFGLVLRLPGSVPPDVTNFPFIPSADNSSIDVMCEVTGGRSYAVYSQKMINAALESLVQKVQSGVVISFEKFGPDPPPPPLEGLKSENGSDSNGNAKENQDVNKQIIEDVLEDKKSIIPVPPQQLQHPSQQLNNINWQCCRRLIYVPRSAQKGYSVGHWPIPEAFWPDMSNPTLPPRTAHPVVRFSCTPCEPMVIENLPFDKYELEPSPLTQYILERRQPNICWQIFVANSAKYGDMGHPFGYLKASSALTTVNLFVMPYNYPVLLPLLDELFKVHKLKPTQTWRQQFDKYLKSMPGYYAGPLRRALVRMGAPNLVPDNLDNCLSYSVITYLKKLKNQAKVEMDRLNASVGQKVPLNEGINVDSRTKTSVLQRRDFSQLLASLGGNISILKQELMTDYSSFRIAVPDPSLRPQCYRNPYDIPRKNLLDQVTRMRKNLLQTSHMAQTLMEQEESHSVPVQQMGNYQEQLKKQPPPLRPIDNQPIRLHTFGNPFKVNKQNMLMIDEAEDAVVFGNQSPKRKIVDSQTSLGPGRKRKPGPLPRNVPYRVLASPVRTPPASPAWSMSDDNASVLSEDESPLSIVIDEDTDEEGSECASNHVTTPVSNHVISNHNHISRSGDESDQELRSHVMSNNISSDGDLKGTCVAGSTNKYASGAGSANSVTNNKNNSISYNNRMLEIWNFNCKLKTKICKEVKKPGRDFNMLFKYLGTVQGNLHTRCAFVRDIIQEAMRFKRKSLITLLKQFEESLLKGDSKNKQAKLTFTSGSVCSGNSQDERSQEEEKQA